MIIQKIVFTKPNKNNNFRTISGNTFKQAGVYFLYDKNLELIYIGKTKSIRQRIVIHIGESNKKYDDKRMIYNTPLQYQEAQYYSYIKIDDEDSRTIFEKVLIHLFKPKHNINC